MANTHELLNKMTVAQQKEEALEIINYTDNMLGFGGVAASSIFGLSLDVLKKHLEGEDIFKASLKNSLECVQTGDKGKIGKFLAELESDNNKSFIILPVTAKEHLFSLVFYKEGDEYKCIAVNKGSRETERGLAHHAFKKYTLGKDKIQELLAHNVIIQEKLNEKRDTTVQIYELLDRLAGVENDSSRVEEMGNIDARNQTVGNCFYKEILEAIKFAYSNAYDSFEEIKFWHDNKAVNLKVPKWPVETQSMNIELLRCIQTNSENLTVKEFIEDLIKTYNKNKSFRDGIKENIMMTFEHKKELLMRAFNFKEDIDISKLKEEAFLKDCLKTVDIETLGDNFDFFMDLLKENNVEIPEILQKDMQYWNFRIMLRSYALSNENVKTFLSDYFPTVFENIKRFSIFSYNEMALQELQARNLERAMNLCNQSIQNCDMQVSAYATMATINTLLGNFAQARDDYKKCLERLPRKEYEEFIVRMEELDKMKQVELEQRKKIDIENPNLDDVSNYIQTKYMLVSMFNQLGLVELSYTNAEELIDLVNKYETLPISIALKLENIEGKVKVIQEDIIKGETIEESILEKLYKEIEDYEIKLQDKKGDNIQRYVRINMAKVTMLIMRNKKEDALKVCENISDELKQLGEDYAKREWVLEMVNYFSNSAQVLKEDIMLFQVQKEATLPNEVLKQEKNVDNNLPEIEKDNGLILDLKTEDDDIYNSALKTISQITSLDNKFKFLDLTMLLLTSDRKKCDLCRNVIINMDNLEQKLQVLNIGMKRLTNPQQNMYNMYKIGLNLVDNLVSKDDKIKVLNLMLSSKIHPNKKLKICRQIIGYLDKVEDKVEVFFRTMSELNKDVPGSKWENRLATEMIEILDKQEDKLNIFSRVLPMLKEDKQKYELAMDTLKKIEDKEKRLTLLNETLKNLDYGDYYISIANQNINYCLDLKKESEALDVMEILREKGNKNYAILNKEAKILLGMGRKTEALKVYEEVLNITPNDRRVINTVKQLSDDNILTQSLTSNIDKGILDKLHIVDFKDVKSEELTKLLDKLENVDSSLTHNAQIIKDKINRYVSKDKKNINTHKVEEKGHAINSKLNKNITNQKGIEFDK